MATSSAPDEILYYSGHPHDGEKFFYWVGRSITAWADVEHQLFRLFLKCLSEKRKLAIKIFDRCTTLSLKLQLIDEVLSVCLSQERYKNWKSILKEINRIVPIRNALAHNPVHTYTKIETRLVDGSDVIFGGAKIIHYLTSHAHKSPKASDTKLEWEAIADHFTSTQSIVAQLRSFYAYLPKILKTPQPKSPQQRSLKPLDSDLRQQKSEKPSPGRRPQRKPSQA